MAGSGDLYAAMEEYLGVCLEALADTPEGAPECAYIDGGPPAWDHYPCLIVYAGGPVTADTFPLQPSLAPAHRIAMFGEVDLVTITATILRCAVVMGDESSIEVGGITDYERVARQTSADLWAVLNHLKDAKREERLFPPRSREFVIDSPVALNQEGGAAGWQVTVRTQLDGYRPGE